MLHNHEQGLFSGGGKERTFGPCTSDSLSDTHSSLVYSLKSETRPEEQAGLKSSTCIKSYYLHLRPQKVSM